MLHAATLASVVLMLMIYLVQARKSRERPDHEDPDRFFLSSHAHSKEEYGSAQIAYFLQMATVYPFFLLSFSGQWWLAIWNTALYVVGIVLFLVLLPRFHKGGLDLVGRSSTPHALIASLHREPKLRTLASLLSMFAFIGLALFETVWGTAALKIVLGGNSYLYYMSILIFAFYLITVLWIGGQRAEIRTAQWQLVIAYIGLHLVTGWTLSKYPDILSKTDAPFVFVAIFAAGAWTIIRRLNNWKQDGRREMMLLNIAAVLSLGYVLWSIGRTPGFFCGSLFSVKPISLPPEWPWMLFTLGWMPIFFQFVDMTNWQRLSSLKGDDVIASARTGLWQFAVESPLSWLFPIAMGLTAAIFLSVADGQDAWLVFLEKTTALGGAWGIVSVLLVIGLICVFLSTANALMSATGYAWAYDVHAPTREIMDRIHAAKDEQVVTEDERARVTNAGRLATSFAIAFAAILYVILDASFDLGARVLGIFFAFFTPVLSFIPGMLVPMWTGRAAAPNVAYYSMLLSALAGIGVGIYSYFGPPIFAWLSVPICTGLSLGIYFCGYLISNREVPKTGPEELDQSDPE
jgi:hypothetical protein